MKCSHFRSPRFLYLYLVLSRYIDSVFTSRCVKSRFVDCASWPWQGTTKLDPNCFNCVPWTFLHKARRSTRQELMSSSENLRDRLTLSPKRVGSVFLGDIQRHRLFASPSSRITSAQTTPTSSPPPSTSMSGVFALHQSHGHHSSLDDDIDIDMDPPEPAPATVIQQHLNATTATLNHGKKPGKIDPILALELRLRWLEALILGIKQDLGRERKGKGKDVAEYASFGNAQMIASANLKRGETLMRLAESVQQKLDKALEANEGLKRFMDNCLSCFLFVVACIVLHSLLFF